LARRNKGFAGQTRHLACKTLHPARQTRHLARKTLHPAGQKDRRARRNKGLAKQIACLPQAHSNNQPSLRKPSSIRQGVGRVAVVADEPKDESKKPRPLWLSFLIEVAGAILILTLCVIGVSLLAEVGNPDDPDQGRSRGAYDPIEDGSIWDTVLFKRTEYVPKMWLWTMKWILPFAIACIAWNRRKAKLTNISSP